MRHALSIVWFRRDLRLADHVALERALRASERVVCAFVLDPELLRGPRVGAPLVAFFMDSLAHLREQLRKRGSDLALLEGDFLRELGGLSARLGATALYFNLDYETHARVRDARVSAGLRRAGVVVEASLDHVYFGAEEALKADGTPYTVFTPYKRRWLERLAAEPRSAAPSLAAIAGRLAAREFIGETRAVPDPADFGHPRSANFPAGGEAAGQTLLERFITERIGGYARDRNVPAVAGTSYLSPHLRAGTVGIRACVDAALGARASARGARSTGIDTWLNELIWRDFYQQVLANFPHVEREPFLPAAKALTYRDAPAEWEAWCAGRTGYPIVDAAMVQLNTYGWMHNRLRMIVASFLTKHLLIDYRRGERYFEQHLADADVAANNGGWQWSASTGTDAAPYFRVFNPTLQSKKFDPDGTFIRRMLPELAALPAAAVHEPWTLAPLEAEALRFRLGRDYPHPIVDHAEARARALAAYAPVLGKKSR